MEGHLPWMAGGQLQQKLRRQARLHGQVVVAEIEASVDSLQNLWVF